MPKCSFCGKMYEIPRGLTFVLADGTVLYFCSAKCNKNWTLGRKTTKVGWVRKMKHSKEEKIAEIKEEKTEGKKK